MELCVDLERVPEGAARARGVISLRTRLGLHQARLDVAAVGPVPSFLPREPPRISAMASTSSNLQVSLVSPWGAGAKVGGGEEGGSGRAPVARREEGGAQPQVGESVLPARFRGLPSTLLSEILDFG